MGSVAQSSFLKAVDRRLLSRVVSALGSLRARRASGRSAGGPVRRILAIKFHGLGNIVMLAPSLRGLRVGFPDARIDLLTLSSNRGLCERLADVSRVLYVESGGPTASVRSLIEVALGLRGHYDLVVDYEQFLYVSSLVTLWVDATRSVGLICSNHNRHLAYSVPVPFSPALHMTDTFLSLAAAVGGSGPPSCVDLLQLTEADMEELAAFEAGAGIRQDDVVAILHPGSSANMTMRRWRADRFAALGDLLAERHGVKVVLSGTAAERDVIESVRREMRTPPILCAGELSLAGFVALCQRAELLVSNDTGPVHIGSAVGTPVVGIYGPNTPHRYGPRGSDDLVLYRDISCSPCLVNDSWRTSDCSLPACMDSIGVEEVYGLIRAKYFGANGSLKPRYRKSRRPAGARDWGT